MSPPTLRGEGGSIQIEEMSRAGEPQKRTPNHNGRNGNYNGRNEQRFPGVRFSRCSASTVVVPFPPLWFRVLLFG